MGVDFVDRDPLFLGISGILFTLEIFPAQLDAKEDFPVLPFFLGQENPFLPGFLDILFLHLTLW